LSVILHIPCDEEGALSRVEITRSLDMTFLDHDIVYDQSIVAFGGNPSICLGAYETWQEAPMWFLCNSGFVQVPYLGIISCGIVRRSIKVVRDANPGVSMSCLKHALGLVNICEKQFRKLRRDVSRVYHWKQSLTGAWNARVSGGRKREEMPSFGEAKLVSAAILCFDMVMDHWDHLDRYPPGWAYPPEYPHAICQMARHAIASVTFKGSTWHPEGFKGLMEQMPPDLTAELKRIARMEASWAVEILEGL